MVHSQAPSVLCRTLVATLRSIAEKILSLVRSGPLRGDLNRRCSAVSSLCGTSDHRTSALLQLGIRALRIRNDQLGADGQIRCQLINTDFFGGLQMVYFVSWHCAFCLLRSHRRCKICLYRVVASYQETPFQSTVSNTESAYFLAQYAC